MGASQASHLFSNIFCAPPIVVFRCARCRQRSYEHFRELKIGGDFDFFGLKNGLFLLFIMDCLHGVTSAVRLSSLVAYLLRLPISLYMLCAVKCMTCPIHLRVFDADIPPPLPPIATLKTLPSGPRLSRTKSSRGFDKRVVPQSVTGTCAIIFL